ncbi:MAG: TetR/AcrR family transcriptional regulator [Sphingomonadales bacterium]
MVKKIAEIRRPEIVQALYAAIQSDGISLPSNDEIARHGEMSRQLIRHYFPSSEDAAVALCDALAATYRDCLMKGIIAADSSRRLGVFLDFYFDFLADKGLPKPADDSVYDALFALAGTSRRVRQNLHEQYSLLQQTLAHEIQISHPTLPQSGCRELGYLIVITMYGHWKMVATLGFSTDYNRVSRQAIDRLIESYLANYVDPEMA